MENNERSAAFCRGRMAGIAHVAAWGWSDRWSWPAPLQAEYEMMEQLLAAAEAREAAPEIQECWIGRDGWKPDNHDGLKRDAVIEWLEKNSDDWTAEDMRKAAKRLREGGE